MFYIGMNYGSRNIEGQVLVGRSYHFPRKEEKFGDTTIITIAKYKIKTNKMFIKNSKVKIVGD